MDNHNRTKKTATDQNQEPPFKADALLLLLNAIAYFADVPQPAGENWTFYNSTCRSRLLTIRQLARVAGTMPTAELIAEANTLIAAAAVLPYKPDLDVAPKDQHAALLARFAPPQPTSTAAAETENQ
jgi:hypothetical protein